MQSNAGSRSALVRRYELTRNFIQIACEHSSIEEEYRIIGEDEKLW